MRVELTSTIRIDGIRFIACLGENRFVAASSDTLIWCQVKDLMVEEVRRSSHEGRSFSLFPIPDHTQAVFQREHSPGDHSFQLLDDEGLKGSPVPIPFSWTNQVTADPSGSLLAAFGSVVIPGRAGWIAPIESCLIDMESGDLQRLPYSAVAIQGDVLYFVQGSTLYKKRLSFSRSLAQVSDSSASPAATEVIASDIPSTVITLAPRTECVRLVATDGLYTASSSGLSAVHKWESASRALVCGDVCFTRDIGPEVYVYDATNHATSCIMSSPKTQVTGFDVFCPSRGDNADQGLLMVVSEKGVLDRFSWNSSNKKKKKVS